MMIEDNLFCRYVDLPVDCEMYLWDDEAGWDGTGVEGFKKEQRVRINSIRVFADKEPLYYIDGTIHGWKFKAFKPVNQIK